MRAPAFVEPGNFDAVTIPRLADRLRPALAARADDGRRSHLTLSSPDGQIDGRPVTMSLERVDSNGFTPRSRGFNWVQEYPYFR
ncbi:hypothetical protein [Mycobacterium sp. GA-2829]|uniref:hypothetical protein n=1 Tax=Mycobacterium sp. GA-2829 TaxID=1772283 RepID=UPI0007404AD1|nr:hypothetical protein [Mycobacterium sp. GA-2829]KUI34640.1 hypothetical protein AU194_27875 [Mycobacterium sp. GA-2829]